MSFSMLYLHIINDQLESTLSTLNTPTNNNVISGERKGLSTHTVCAITLVRHRSRDTLFDREEREERKRRASGQSEKPPSFLVADTLILHNIRDSFGEKRSNTPPPLSLPL